MALREYRAKRKLDKTPEPAGGKPSSGVLRFVVQKHEASRLHYDFRLEMDGVLKSWAVPKGPSLNPDDKRLAMMVEDHPYDYRDFEGIIPKGNYGAGTVMVWDEGNYIDYDGHKDKKAAEKALKAGLAKGDLKFVLNGSKIKGAYVLAKMHSNEDDAWLLIKKEDEYASTKDVTKQDHSVKTGRTMKEIEKGGDEAWLSGVDLSDAPKKAQPTTVKPMLSTLVDEPFDSSDWIYEIKWDGYRILAHIAGGKVTLKSRNNKDYSSIFAPIRDELAKLEVNAVLDGEMVVLDDYGKPSFGGLQAYQKTGQGQLVYYIFDAPYALGRDLTKLPLERRREVAAKIIEKLDNVKFSDHVDGKGKDFFALAEKRGLEGIMAKAKDSPYVAGIRSKNWLKIKTQQRQEAVIGGWTEPKGSRQKIGALILGVYDGKHLRYIGHTGGGLSDSKLNELYNSLKPLERKTSPFADEFKTNSPAHWVQPKLVMEVAFREWTSDDNLRQPVFVGLREDKKASAVVREKAVPLEDSPSVPKAKSSKLEISNRNKLFWPKEKITKGDLIDYYDSIADTILPHLKDRPESLNRHPNGIDGKSFYQKDLENHADWVRTVPLYSESNDKNINWLVANDRDHLLYMINLGCIELHPWLSRIKKPDHPDFCLIDLDAKTSSFADVIKVAHGARKMLDELGIPSYPKTSGKTGLHIAIPLGAKYTYEQSKLLAEILMRRLNSRLPKITSVDRKPDKRHGKIYLDFLQNRRGQTMAAPYCVRPAPGAPVSTPLKWSEVRTGLDPLKFNMNNTARRIKKVGDLWAPVLGPGIELGDVLEKLNEV